VAAHEAKKMQVDLDKMSYSELQKLSKDVAKALSTYEDRRRREALAEMQEVARKHGVDMSEVLGAPRGKGSKSPAKYRNPDDPEQTWTGRGRKPNWVNSALNSGKSLEDLSI
jgi:DNA-binding protein H-NS